MDGVIKLADEATLRSPRFKHLLAIRLVEDKMSRMGGFIFLEEKILNHADDGGRVLNGQGVPIYVHPDVVEEAYGYEMSFSWTTDIKAYADRMPKKRSLGRHLLRLQLWQAAYELDGRPLI